MVDGLDEKCSLASVRPLSGKIAGLLQHGDVAGEYQSRSAIVMAVALGCAGACWPRDVFIEAILDPQNHGGAALLTRRNGKPRPASYGRKEAERAWRKAEAWIAKHPAKADVLAQIVTYRARAGAWRYPLRGGVNVQRVLSAHFDIVERRGSLTHGASVREVAVAAQVSIDAVTRAHLWLVEQGWLILAKAAPRGVRESIGTLAAHCSPSASLLLLLRMR